MLAIENNKMVKPMFSHSSNGTRNTMAAPLATTTIVVRFCLSNIITGPAERNLEREEERMSIMCLHLVGVV
jgi:hypothetical protein